ncbi:S8 family serine peptidase [Haloarchaeobius sp. DFWS5]|uniref:S8 family serine peptidase n=1 Tax=Haloarchaeobius sp. DFWS5 TaxID=3446114 RepID=UPI003EB6A9AD
MRRRGTTGRRGTTAHRGLAVALALVVVLATVAGTATGAGHASADHGIADRMQVIVVFEDDSVRSIEPVLALGGQITGGDSVDLLPVVYANVPIQAIAGLERNPHVAAVYPDAIATVGPVTAQEGQTTPWGIGQVNAQAVAATGLTPADQSRVQVAVIDTGIDWDHEDLRNNVVDWGVDATSNTEDCWWVFCWPAETLSYGRNAANDDSGHGTHVAGTIAGEDNGLGVVGVAPHVQLYSIKVLDSSGSGTYSAIITGMDEAVKGPDGVIGTDDDADVLSMSLSGPTPGGLCDAVDRATAAGAVVVAAAGNVGDGDATTDDVRYPAKCADAIAVAATNDEDTTPTWSSEGPAVDIAGPGVSVYSTDRDDDYSWKSGTSMATPHVSATAALVLAQDLQDGYRDLSPADVRARLVETARDIGAAGVDPDTGYGLVQVDRALGVETQTGAAVGETGSVTVLQSTRDQWHTVVLDHSYATPVVVMDPPSYNGNHALHVRVRNVQSDRFEFRFEEWLVADGSHTSETASYLVVESGVHTLVDGRTLEAGTVSVDEGDDFVAFSAAFGAAPVVLTQTQTVADLDPVVTRVKNVDAGGFSVKLQEEESRGGHATETVGYVALATGNSHLDGTGVLVGKTGNTVTHEWHHIDFGDSLGATPVFLAAQQTTDGGDTAGLRYRNFGGSGVDVKVEEGKSADSEVRHTTEVVGYAVFERAGIIVGY